MSHHLPALQRRASGEGRSHEPLSLEAPSAKPATRVVLPLAMLCRLPALWRTHRERISRLRREAGTRGPAA